eukprot:gb/GECG01005183.1/.p1 GENE.gb/GECG01005183.1/~~gb/GECG01005183.1/.p1  ORF type:complete len:257 (+),score=35.14 gb/GECG01005183.1/:1-771(+)
MMQMLSFLGRMLCTKIFSTTKKMTHAYKSQDIEKELGLTRDDLVRSALLLGSDYTFGVQGIGIVNTVEILRSFPGDEGLENFREWLNGTYKTVEIENLAKSKPSQKTLDSLDPQTKFMLSHRGARKRWTVQDTFPNKTVLQAYRKPTVNSNPAEFTWFTPDLQQLREFCMTKFDWSRDYADRQLLPVMKELVKPKQHTLDQYIVRYEDHSRAAKVKSKRLRDALKGIHGRSDDRDIALDSPNADDDDDGEILSSQE